jgi:hypothetical protein
MTDYYPIVNVNPDWAVGQEAMGTKSKFWYRQPGQDESEWLFKHPRKNTGEHWAEKIAAEVAAVLKIPRARVELAELELGPDGLPPERGSVSESFLADRRDMIHGNEIMAHIFSGYDRGLKFGQPQHTFKNIMAGLRALFGETSQGHKISRILCEYLVLDAVVGNTDRHHENWAVRPLRGLGSVALDIAPSFDHASSLGRELSDLSRERMLSEDMVGRYSERGRGGIYWSETDRHGQSPLQLVRLAICDNPHLFFPALRRIESLELTKLDAIVRRVPPGWMSGASRRFAVGLLYYNCQQLHQLCQEV